jgi:aminoglycoside phosphotransferase (APT) family kinase protein
VAREVAQLQLASRGRYAELLAVGAPNRGLAGTLEILSEILHRSVNVLSAAQRAVAPSLESWLVAGLHELWDGRLPDTVVHGDLHLGNVAWTGTGPVMFDWTDLCLSHPLPDAAHLAESAAAEAGDDPVLRGAAADAVWSAYLQPWRAAYPDVDLDAVRPRVPLAEAVFQAITYEQIYRAQPERSRWELATFVGRSIDTLVGLRNSAVTPAGEVV